MMRPSVSSPTGTVIGAPVSVTSWPRMRPSDDVHGDAAHGVFAEMLRDFEDEAVALVGGLQRVQDLRQVTVELHVDDGADDLGDAARGLGWRSHVFVLRLFKLFRALRRPR